MMTYVEALEVAINAVDGEVAEKLTALKVQMSKKHVSSKPTKTQVENEGIKAEILDVLASADKPLRASEIVTLMPRDGLTPQKVAALLKQLVKAETVVKTVDKKVSTFALA